MSMIFPWRHTIAAALLATTLFDHPISAPIAFASTDEISRVVELTNLERIKAGLQPLVANTSLAGASQKYSGVLATDQCWAHTCGPEPEFAKRAASSGYTGWTRLGENIAAGQRTPEEVVASWMNSPGHRANILNPDFNEIGVGLVRAGKMGAYWTQMFGTRPNARPTAAQDSQPASVPAAAPASVPPAPALEAPSAPARVPAETGPIPSWAPVGVPAEVVPVPSWAPAAPEAPLTIEDVANVPEHTVEGVGESESPAEAWEEALEDGTTLQLTIAVGDW
ncbi:MAG TPA: CAP domain-containing protein [Chloroflexota bacterium]|nr:CAP domain-containing protein [Chloroflexota bacterium]